MLFRSENIFVMDADEASKQDIRPLKIVILNLMPVKVTTENDLIRLLSNTPLQLEIDFMMIKGHVSKNTSADHLNAFYKTFDQLKENKYDGMIITGAPLEQLDYEEVKYWDEMKSIFDWSRSHVTSTMYICWAAQAGLYHFYGVPKYSLEKKMFGIFKHTANVSLNPIFRGFDDEFYVPHSRHSEVRRSDIENVNDLTILSESDDSGVYMVMARGGREIFLTGHAEYAPYTLDTEYKRDASQGLEIEVPVNYYKNNNPENEPVVKWRSCANLMFANWLNYFVYQETPYDIRDIK